MFNELAIIGLASLITWSDIPTYKWLLVKQSFEIWVDLPQGANVAKTGVSLAAPLKHRAIFER